MDPVHTRIEVWYIAMLLVMANIVADIVYHRS
jgi:hypothetical protein